VGTAAIISLILSAAGMLGGTAMSAAANKKYDKFLDKRQTKLDNWYNKEYNTNYLDTDEAKATMQILRNRLDEQQKASSQANAMRGASDEAALASVTEGQKVMADTGLGLAAKGTERKDNIQTSYMNQDYNLAGMKAQNMLNKSQNYSNLVSNAGNLMGSALTVGTNNGQAAANAVANPTTPLVQTPLTGAERNNQLLEQIRKHSTELLGQKQ